MSVSDNKRLVSYSFLAHINNNKQGFKDFNDIFAPLVKKGLSELNKRGSKSGKSIIEIKNLVDNVFALDIPIPLMKELLRKIAKETNSDDNPNEFVLNKDGSFTMNMFLFADYDETIEKQSYEISLLESSYQEYLVKKGFDTAKEPRLIDFIDQNSKHLSKYFSTTNNIEEQNFLAQARFFNSLDKKGEVFRVLRDIYLGSIIASYLHLNFEKVEANLEFVLDTNFILGLLDLNSPESTHTCRKIYEISENCNFSLTVLNSTLEQTKNLLKNTTHNLNTTFVQKLIDPESIFSACERRNLSVTDLERITGNLEKQLTTDYGVHIIYNDEKYQNKARYNYREVLDHYAKIRKDSRGALHDATAEVYVMEKRGRIFKNFIDSKCWFVSNTKHPLYLRQVKKDSLPYIIRSDILVNILWLSNPAIKSNLDGGSLADLGITRMVSSTISRTLPKARILKEFDENLIRYRDEEKISEEDCLRAASKIAESTVNFEKYNRMAQDDSEKFIQELLELSRKKQEEEKERELASQKVIRDSLKKVEDAEASKRQGIKEEKYNRYLELSRIFEGFEKRSELESSRIIGATIIVPILLIIVLIAVFGWSKFERWYIFLTLIFFGAEYLSIGLFGNKWDPLKFRKEIKRLRIEKKISSFNFNKSEYDKLKVEFNNVPNE